MKRQNRIKSLLHTGSALGVILILAGASISSAQDKVGTTAAPFLTIGVGSRAGAMGGSYVAVAEGPSAMFWNPAGIASVTRPTLEFSYATWFVDATIQQAAFAMNMPGVGNVGLSVQALSYGEMQVTTIASPDGTGELFSPLDFVVGVTYGRALTDRFQIGGSGKLISQRIWNSSASGFAMDLGVHYRAGWKNLRIGASMSNFGTNMRLSGQDLRVAHDIDLERNGNNPRLPANMEVESWALPLTFRVGLAADVLASERHMLTAALDALHPNDNSESVNFGLEYGFSSLVFLRGGYRSAFSSESSDGGWTLGAGIDYELSGGLLIKFDYMYQQFQQGRLDASQMFTLGLGF
jgi:opacity protein-like surface antigen